MCLVTRCFTVFFLEVGSKWAQQKAIWRSNQKARQAAFRGRSIYWLKQQINTLNQAGVQSCTAVLYLRLNSATAFQGFHTVRLSLYPNFYFAQ